MVDLADGNRLTGEYYATSYHDIHGHEVPHKTNLVESLFLDADEEEPGFLNGHMEKTFTIQNFAVNMDAFMDVAQIEPSDVVVKAEWNESRIIGFPRSAEGIAASKLQLEERKNRTKQAYFSRVLSGEAQESAAKKSTSSNSKTPSLPIEMARHITSNLYPPAPMGPAELGGTRRKRRKRRKSRGR